MTDAPDFNPMPADELQALWQADPVEVSPMVLIDVHRRAVRFETLQRWHLIVYAVTTAVGFLMAGFVMLRMEDGILSVGYSLVALGILFAFYYRHNRNPANPQALSGASQDCLDFYRRILKRRIRLIQTAWAWSMLPILPGAIIIFWRVSQIVSIRHQNARITSAQGSLIILGLEIFLGVFLVTRFATQQLKARRLQRELHSLTSAAGQ